jgi:hypothetical protein
MTELRSGVSDISSLRSHMRSLGQLTCVEFAIRLQMAQVNVDDLALLEEAVADDALNAFLLAAPDQTDHSVDVSKVAAPARS